MLIGAHVCIFMFTHVLQMVCTNVQNVYAGKFMCEIRKICLDKKITSAIIKSDI